jgi:hypothetical protein
MSGVAWNQVRDRLASALPVALGPTVKVYNGPAVSNENPSSYLTVGHAPSTNDESAGRFDQEVGPDGFSAAETGNVLCELAAVTGNSVVPSVFDTFAALAAWVQSDMTLGGALSPGSTCTVAADVVQEQTTSGAVQRLVVSVNYFTRL